ncbi:MAG: phage holin family protein [Patescibacteria group bacterium]
MQLVFILIANALAILATAYLIPGIEVSNFMTAVLAALVLGLFNVFLRPILSFLALPANLLTLGLFSWVISAFLLWLTGRVVGGFDVNGFLPALIGGVVIAFVSTFLQSLVKKIK